MTQTYTHTQVARMLDNAHHARSQRGALTSVVTDKFGNDATTKGVDKLLTALTNGAHADHTAAIAALNELLAE